MPKNKLQVYNVSELPPAVRQLPWFRVLANLGKHANNAHLLIIITHGFIELLVNALIDAKCKNAKKIVSSSRDFPHSSKLLILHEMGILNDYRYKALNYLWKLRNEAAHDPFFTVDMPRLTGEFNALRKIGAADSHALKAPDFH